jgi:putative transposase
VLKGAAPQAFEAALNFHAYLLDPEFSLKDVTDKQEGKIHLIRFIRSDIVLHVLGEPFLVKPECHYEYVKANIDVKKRCLTVFLFDEVIHEFKYDIPKYR